LLPETATLSQQQFVAVFGNFVAWHGQALTQHAVRCTCAIGLLATSDVIFAQGLLN